jgi:hypothetical protein
LPCQYSIFCVKVKSADGEATGGARPTSGFL